MVVSAAAEHTQATLHAPTSYVRFVSIDPEHNRARFYELLIQPTLWGEVSLIRQWGRIGGGGGQRQITFHQEWLSAEAEFGALIAHRMKRGYVMADFA